MSATASEKNKPEAASTRAELMPLYVVQLDDTHAVLLTDTSRVDGSAERYTCHACSQIVDAYFFEHDANGWRLTARQDAAVDSGVEGEIGTTNIHNLANGTCQ